MEQMRRVRERLRSRSVQHVAALRREAKRLASSAAALGAQRVVLFGSLISSKPGLASDIDLLVIWNTPLDFLARTVEMYRRLRPRAPVDLLVYTPHEMEMMVDRPFIRRIFTEGRVLYEA
jgi:predicted nucleotidyltransferase